MNEDQLFYVGQKAFINKDGDVLVLSNDGQLDFPGGKIQTHETDFVESLKREVTEETGLSIEVQEPFATWSRLGHRGAHKGKKIFLIGYKCEYSKGEVRLSTEHQDFKWVNKENYKKLAENGDYFKALEKYFKGA